MTSAPSTPASAVLATGSSPARDDRAALAIVLIGLAGSILYAIRSTGAYQLDDLAHFKFAQWSWTHPSFLMHEWGRPGFTVLYAIPAWFGWTAARIFTAVLCSATGWLTYRIAQRMQMPRPWLVVVLLYLQPGFFQLSFVTLTESTLAFYLAASVALAQRGRWSLSAAVLSLAFLTRYEALVFLPIWVFVAWRQGVSLWRLWPLFWALAAQTLLSPVSHTVPFWERWLNLRPTTYYGHGGWLSMLCRSLEAWGPGLAAVAFCGVPSVLRQPGGGLIVYSLLAYFGAHTAIWALGVVAGGGMPRYLVPVSPLVAICAADALRRLCTNDAAARRRLVFAVTLVMAVVLVGVEIQMRSGGVPFYVPNSHYVQWLCRVMMLIVMVCCVSAYASRREPPDNARNAHRAAIVLVVTLLGAQFVAWGQLVRAVAPLPQERAAAETLAWIDRNKLNDRALFYCDLCVASLRGDVFPTAGRPLRDRVAEANTGCLVLWDCFYQEAWYELTRRELDAAPAFRLIFESTPIPRSPEAHIRLYEKVGPWKP